MTNLADVESDAAVKVVVSYLQARMNWELRAHRELESAGYSAPAARAIQGEYEELLRQFCAPSVLRRRLRFSYGHPPDVNPERTQIETVRSERGGIVVTTREDVERGAKPREYEYVLEVNGGELLIADRRTRDRNGRWIRGVL